MSPIKNDSEFRGDFLLDRLEHFGLSHETVRRWGRLQGPKKYIFAFCVTHICPLGTNSRQWWVNSDRWNQIAPAFDLPTVTKQGLPN